MTADIHDGKQNSGDLAEDIGQEAQAWLTLFYCEEADEADRHNFSEWLQRSEKHVAAFAKAEKLWDQLAFSPEMLKEPSDRQDRSFSSLLNRRGVLGAIAASIIVMIGVSIVFWQTSVTTDHYRTALGEVENIILADGTKVTLNAASYLETHISNTKREVLLRGGAFFDVVRDESRPFRVTVGGTEVKVLGTAFEVWEGPRTVRVSVVRGAVEVGEGEENAIASLVKLTAGEQVITSLDGHPGKIRSFDPKAALAWRTGHLIYIDVPLEDIVADVNRYRKKKIIITDAALGALRITTAFRVEQANKMLAGLSQSNPLIVEEKSSGVYIRPLSK